MNARQALTPNSIPRRSARSIGIRVALLMLQWWLVVSVLFSILYLSNPDPTFALLGKQPTQAQIDNLSATRLQAAPIGEAYLQFFSQIFYWDFGTSPLNGKPVTSALSDGLLVSMSLILPALVLGHIVSMSLAASAVMLRNRPVNRMIRWLSALLLSFSVLVIMVVLQWLFSSPDALHLLPARGWQTHSFTAYAAHWATPGITIVLLVVAVYTRFYHHLIADQWQQEYCGFARELGVSRRRLFSTHIWPNIRSTVTTRALITIPPFLCGGAFVVESYFGIPGMGKLAYDAFLSADTATASGILVVTASALILVQFGLDLSQSRERTDNTLMVP